MLKEKIISADLNNNFNLQSAKFRREICLGRDKITELVSLGWGGRRPSSAMLSIKDKS